MWYRLRLHLKNFDWILWAAVMLLTVFGLIEIYSVALGQETMSLLNFKKQIIFIVIGLVLMFTLAFTDFHFLKSFSKYFYILAVIFLVAVLLLGSTIRGTRGWFNLGGFNFQPVEFVKVALLLYLSSYFSDLATKIKTARNLFRSGLTTLLLVGLVLLQPDFGSSLMLVALWLVLLVLAGFKKKYFLIIILVAGLVFSSAWFFGFKDYQKQRLLTFINPQADSLSGGYNVSQAIIAVGSGGWTGKGVGFGSQSQLKFLPEAQTDFIFAVIAEELGFWGVTLVLAFFAIFFARCLLAIRKINNDFGIYFILGGASLIFIQMFINMAMNMGMVPVVGLSLPFVSYGGSGLISLFALVGIIENIIIKSKISY